MNSIRMFLNYLDLSNILVILTAILITIVTYLLLSSDISIFSEESSVNNKKIKERDGWRGTGGEIVRRKKNNSNNNNNKLGF